MLVEIVKDAMSVITKECTEEQAAAYAANFVVNVVNEDGTKTPYGVAPAEPPPADDAFVAVGATRFSDGKKQTKKSLAEAQAAWEEAHPE